MAHIVIVCTANICRSPLAAAELRRRLHGLGLTDWVVDSAGTWATLSRPPSRFSSQIAQRNGMDISDHRAQSVTTEMMATADLVLCMTANHKEALQLEFSGDADKIYLFSEMIGRRFDISDPYGGPYEGYEEMWVDLNRLLNQGLPRIIELAETHARQANA